MDERTDTPHYFDKDKFQTKEGELVFTPNGKGTFNLDCENFIIRGVAHTVRGCYKLVGDVFVLSSTLYVTKELWTNATADARAKAEKLFSLYANQWAALPSSKALMYRASVREARREIASALSAVTKLEDELVKARIRLNEAHDELERRGNGDF